MPDWREKADALFPELAEEFEWVDSPMSLWITLNTEFKLAYEEPRNESLIHRVYEYANWCVQQEQTEEKDATKHLLTCVVVCFWEPLPTNHNARADMPNWFTYEDIVSDRPIFSYYLTEQEFDDLLALFPEHKRPKDNPRKRARMLGNRRR